MIKTKYPLFCFCLVVFLFAFFSRVPFTERLPLAGSLTENWAMRLQQENKNNESHFNLMWCLLFFIPKHWLKQFSLFAIPVRFLCCVWLIFFLIVVALHVENFSLDYGSYFALVVTYWYLLLPVRSVKRHQRHVLRIGQWHALVGSSASISER